MRRLLLILVLLLSAPPTTAHGGSVTEAGDALQYALPALALAMTLGFDDPQGMHQFAKSAAFINTSTIILKHSIDAERPDGRGKSFPSGHTACAFSGASFVARRYGWRLGLPAYAAASFVAWSRVHARRHHVYDVIGAAAITVTSVHLFVDPLPDRAMVLPVVGRDSYGVLLEIRW